MLRRTKNVVFYTKMTCLKSSVNIGNWKTKGTRRKAHTLSVNDNINEEPLHKEI